MARCCTGEGPLRPSSTGGPSRVEKTEADTIAKAAVAPIHPKYSRKCFCVLVSQHLIEDAAEENGGAGGRADEKVINIKRTIADIERWPTQARCHEGGGFFDYLLKDYNSKLGAFEGEDTGGILGKLFQLEW
eukprot:594676-Rhodomonas_salina.2